MKIFRKFAILCFSLLCTAMLAACGEDETLTVYQNDMNTFFEHIATFNDNMNSIDASSEDAADQLLSYLDQLQAEFTWMAGLEVPDRFSAVDSLADEADENMKQAVSLYHQAYEAEVFDEAVELDGIVLTKLDSSAKGGFVVSLCNELAIPVAFVGTGEKLEDLETFSAEDFVEALI